MSKRVYIIEIEDSEARYITAHLVGKGVIVHNAEEEFGQDNRGFEGILPVGSATPKRGRERYVRFTGPWKPIREGDWYGYNIYGTKNVDRETTTPESGLDREQRTYNPAEGT